MLSNEHKTKCYVIAGVWTIVPEEYCPPVRVRVWVRVRVKFWGQFSSETIDLEWYFLTDRMCIDDT